MNMELFVHDCLEKFRVLGFNVPVEEKSITEMFTGMPEEVLEAMETEQIVGLILSYIGVRGKGSEQDTPEMYVFDMEVFEIEQMYTRFLEEVSRLSGGELKITEVEEKADAAVLESGTGIQEVRFCCNGTYYQYDAEVYYDWFDVRMLTYMDQVIEEQNTDRHLYVTGDGYQACIVLYRTEEWAQKFRELLGMELERP